MPDQTPPKLHPPYVWFGGKRKVAPMVWAALGDVDHYCEPFFGGGAVLLMRPHAGRLETINDADGFVCNFWRAVAAEPDAVAEGLDWPINEVDLEARHRALCRMPEKAAFLDRMKHDPAYYDVERAAWWCWGVNAWIGAGWCGGEYWPDALERSAGRGLGEGAAKMPSLVSGRGVHRKMPDMGGPRGVHRQKPHLADGGRGTHRPGELAGLRAWMRGLADRLRRVRVCCGDWGRVCTDGALAHGRVVGVFLDPPYSGEAGRDGDIYRCEDLAVAERVRAWCIERTDRERLRVVLAGYAGEHDDLERLGWRVAAWKTQGGFGNLADGRGRDNAARERLWFSPSCIPPAAEALPLFAEADVRTTP